jgi:hypothetical protein
MLSGFQTGLDIATRAVVRNGKTRPRVVEFLQEVCDRLMWVVLGPGVLVEAVMCRKYDSSSVRACVKE